MTLTPDPRTDLVIAEYDRLVRESEDKNHPARRLVAAPVGEAHEATFKALLDLADRMGWGERKEDGSLVEGDRVALRNTMAAYRQRLTAELMEEAFEG